MRFLYIFLLYAFHSIYSIILAVHSFWKRHSEPAPQSLHTPRKRIPKHLAIVFAVDSTVPEEEAKEVLIESVVDAVSWCRTVGVKKLTVHERNGLLSKSVDRLPFQNQDIESSDSETDYPITPPPSDYSESRSLSPAPSLESIIPIATLYISSPKDTSEQRELRRRHGREAHKNTTKDDVLLCITSRNSSTPAIANAARALAQGYKKQSRHNSLSQLSESYKLSVAELEHVLEDDEGLSSPDFMIIHPVQMLPSRATPAELHGFPPWHIRLTEIFLNRPHKSTFRKWLGLYQESQPLPLDETSFRAALDEYSSAEMRFGK